MKNAQELSFRAERAGFASTLICPFGSAVAGMSEPGDPFSICVAAPPYNVEDRYRPFNFNKDASSDLIERNLSLLRFAASKLSSDGSIFIYGLPAHLSRYATGLSASLTFRYWVAVRTMSLEKGGGLRPEHTGLLILSKPGAGLNRVRIPHPECRHCGRTLKDWGGKSHLMNPEGVALSDVWMDLVVDPLDPMPVEVFDRILQLSPRTARSRLLVLSDEALPQIPARGYDDQPGVDAFDPVRCRGPLRSRALPDALVDRLHKAPCLNVLKAIPSQTIDLAFADPPFNLMKRYNGYMDDRRESDYTGWCKRWLVEYERVLKPGGSLFVLNLPKWSIWLADFLVRTRGLYLQSWIVWNSLPEPKGLLMPAHYGLLYFTKGESAARFNYRSMDDGWEPFDEAVFPPDRADVCQRRACVRKRRGSGATWRGEMTDIWYDIHRERRPKRAGTQGKAHPCETPERLLDRILRLASDPGDLVLDAFAGTGTTALVARRLGRRFIGIEQDASYLEAAEHRMSGPKSTREAEPCRAARGKISKRGLQLELKRLALMLGRLPTKSDVESLSKYHLQVFESAFPSWNVALKAARMFLRDHSTESRKQTAPPQAQLELFSPSVANIHPSGDGDPAIEGSPEYSPDHESSALISDEGLRAGDEMAGSNYPIN